MNAVDAAIAAMNTFNAVAPGIANLILMIRHPDGTISVATVLDKASDTFAQDVKTAEDWLASHKE